MFFRCRFLMQKFEDKILQLLSVDSFQIFGSQAVCSVEIRKTDMPNMISKNTTRPFLEITPRRLPWNCLVEGILRGRHCMKSWAYKGQRRQSIETGRMPMDWQD